MLVRRSKKSNWLTKEGVALKRAELEKKGIPNMRRWRFITLTLDPSLWEDIDFRETPNAPVQVIPAEVQGYLAGKERMRRWLLAMREILGDAAWCWKLEFQDNGWAHWHVCYSYKGKMTEAEMRAIGRLSHPNIVTAHDAREIGETAVLVTRS